MRKILLFSASLALFSVSYVHGASRKHDYEGDGYELVDRIKFGVGYGVGIDKGLSIAAYGNQPSHRFIDLFGEYMVNDEIGVRFSLQPTLSHKSELHKVVTMGYLKIAPTLRVYMGTNRQFCLFVGPQLGWLVSAGAKKQDFGGKEKVLDYFVEKDLEKEVGFPGWQVGRFARGLKLGWDYECKNGLIVGGVFTSEWAMGDDLYAKNTSGSGASSDDKVLNLLVLQGQQLFYLGYNFAKLFN